jgi:hypothetical protein
MKEFGNLGVLKKLHRQKRVDGTVLPKKAGRPAKPNMEWMKVRIDKVLHARLRTYSEKMHTNKSSIVSFALLNFLKQDAQVDDNTDLQGV